MERPVIMVDTDETPVFCRNQCANVKCAKHISKAYECGGACSMQLLRGQPECAGYISRRKHKWKKTCALTANIMNAAESRKDT